MSKRSSKSSRWFFALYCSYSHASDSRYLLNVFNAYAEEVLHIDPDLLPKADNDQQLSSRAHDRKSLGRASTLRCASSSFMPGCAKRSAPDTLKCGM